MTSQEEVKKIGVRVIKPEKVQTFTLVVESESNSESEAKEFHKNATNFKCKHRSQDEDAQEEERIEGPQEKEG